MEESRHTTDPIRIACLEHARAMMAHASELRVKNFNFFLVIMGVIMAAYASVGRKGAMLVLGAMGALVSLAFLLLDIRGREILDAANRELVQQESELGLSIQATLIQARAGKFIKKAISHTFVYRVIYLAGLALSFSLALLAS